MTSNFPRKPYAFLLFFLKTLTRRQKIGLATLLVITGSVVASNFVMMYGFKILVDKIPQTDPARLWDDLQTPFWVIVACCLYHTVMYRLRDVVDMFTTPYVHCHLREMLVGHIFGHSQEYFHNRFSGELANKLGNMNDAFHSLLWERMIHGFIPTTVAIISGAILLAAIDVKLSLILIAVVIGMCCSLYIIGPRLGRASANRTNRIADIVGQVVDMLGNISNVKNFSNTRHEITLLKKVQVPYIAAYKNFAKWEIIFWGVFDIFISALVIGFIAYVMMNNQETGYSAGDIAACILVAWDSWWRLAQLSWQLTQLSGDIGRMESALDEFVRPFDVVDRQGAVAFNPAAPEIILNDVSFVYKSGHLVFDRFNLTIPAAQKVGVVGLSGAGKTTLCQLLLRNYDINNGVITIGGQDIAQVMQDSLREKIAVIPQDPALFHRTLMDNIRYGKPEASDDEVMAAARAAQAHEFIIATSDGYNTMVGERGVKLSGGQRQRIAIARAILKNAPVLILDEATSALDSETERLIQSALHNAMVGRTTIVVAHRLSTLAHLDRIIVMKDGQVVEDGNLSQLIAANGHFAYLWNLQAGGFLP